MWCRPPGWQSWRTSSCTGGQACLAVACLARHTLACGRVCRHHPPSARLCCSVRYGVRGTLVHDNTGNMLPCRLTCAHRSNHHKFPSDVDRLVFPPLPACLPASIIYGVLRCCLPRVGSDPQSQ